MCDASGKGTINFLDSPDLQIDELALRPPQQ
jgi:hypothetical protein